MAAGPLRTGGEGASSPGCFVFDVDLICILKGSLGGGEGERMCVCVWGGGHYGD